MKRNVGCFVSGMGVELKLSPKLLRRILRSETSCAFFKPCIAEWSWRLFSGTFWPLEMHSRGTPLLHRCWAMRRNSCAVLGNAQPF